VSQFNKTVIPGELNAVSSRWVERDPWFDRPFDKLTVLSQVEGGSRNVLESQIILDPPPKAAGDDEL
jgi:hypothetical protein